jgi:hypothetical protein
MRETVEQKDPGTAASVTQKPNGAGAAAVLAAGVGAFVLGALAVLADKNAAIKSAMIFWQPTGPLSGVTALAIAVWLLVWAVLHWRWRGRQVQAGCTSTIALILLGLALLLTFPPIADLL